jgi:KaiC/GvpD/RAD55 family RecA-like ATPase
VETIDADHREMVRKPGAEIISQTLRHFERHLASRLNPNSRGIFGGAGKCIVPNDDSFSCTRYLINLGSGHHEQNMTPGYAYLDRFYTVDYSAIRSEVPSPHPGTCAWILEDAAVNAWFTGGRDASNTFWLHGYPGWGKSVFSRFFLETLEDRGSTTIYFFCSYRNDMTRTVNSLVRSLIHQLLLRDSSLSRVIDSIFRVVDDTVTDSESNLWQILGDLVSRQTFSGGVVLVIDALDELVDVAWNDFFRNLSYAARKRCVVGLTSRKERSIEFGIRGIDPLILDLSSSTRNRNDVAVYVRDSVTEYARENSFDTEAREGIIREITSRADGMFLWANLAWAYFTDGVGIWTKAELSMKMESPKDLPPGIAVLYHRILQAVDSRYRRKLLRCLEWVAMAYRPLTIRELSIAFAARQRPHIHQLIETHTPLNLDAFLRETCPHLVKIDNDGVVRLVHESFSSFLLATPLVSDLGGAVSNVFQVRQNAELELALDCLSYLGLEDYEHENRIGDEFEGGFLVKYPFLSYCLNSWYRHFHRFDEQCSIWSYLSKVFLPAQSHQNPRMRWYPNRPTIFYLWDWGLRDNFAHAIESGLNINEPSDFCPHIYVEGHIVYYARDCPESHIDRLISLGADANGTGGQGRTVLHGLISDNKISHVRAWAEREGVDVNFRDKFGLTGIHIAAMERTPAEFVDILTRGRVGPLVLVRYFFEFLVV